MPGEACRGITHFGHTLFAGDIRSSWPAMALREARRLSAYNQPALYDDKC